MAHDVLQDSLWAIFPLIRLRQRLQALCQLSAREKPHVVSGEILEAEVGIVLE